MQEYRTGKEIQLAQKRQPRHCNNVDLPINKELGMTSVSRSV